MDNEKDQFIILEEIHILPMDDVIEHKDLESCDCSPYICPENAWLQKEGVSNNIIWVHRCIRELRQ